jgi:hypothetical protein
LAEVPEMGFWQRFLAWVFGREAASEEGHPPVWEEPALKLICAHDDQSSGGMSGKAFFGLIVAERAPSKLNNQTTMEGRICKSPKLSLNKKSWTGTGFTTPILYYQVYQTT